ncbi:vacuolar ATPase assembly integral membrane protein VMA21 homolog [Cloeon dipterum]|uniref:vacuolar ATPase assembly integral membrane protein VMA21 homolog n=1 Tax=Cloeon dipterum TaxID=197152 RepID=UPI00321FEF45
MMKDQEPILPERQMFKTVFSYCVLIIAAPVLTFFLAKYYFFDLMFGDGVPSNVWSALSSVVVLHVALGLFIYRAYSEATITKPTTKED